MLQQIKNKNIINFFGKPIISYAITAAIKSNLFDNKEIAWIKPKVKKMIDQAKDEANIEAKKIITQAQEAMKL